VVLSKKEKMRLQGCKVYIGGYAESYLSLNFTLRNWAPTGQLQTKCWHIAQPTNGTDNNNCFMYDASYVSYIGHAIGRIGSGLEVYFPILKQIRELMASPSTMTEQSGLSSHCSDGEHGNLIDSVLV
jgi:hypothetical protein